MIKKPHLKYPAIEGIWHIGKLGESGLSIYSAATVFATINRSTVLDIDGDREAWHILIHHPIPKGIDPDLALRQFIATTEPELEEVFPNVRHDFHVVQRSPKLQTA